MAINLLIYKLKLLELNEEINKYLIRNPNDETFWFDETLPFFRQSASKELLNLVYEIIPLLSKELVLWSGLNNLDNIEIIREAGFEIIPGESDSQGPTNMIIKLKDFKIMYV